MREREFDAYAAEYDALLEDPVRRRFAPGNTFFVSRKIEVILKLLRAAGRDPATLRWLDVGCGRGELLSGARAHFLEARGCDVSAGMLGHAPAVDVAMQPDPGRLPFEDGAFDFVTAVCVFHHVEPADRAGLLAEIKRVLAPDGLIMLVEHNPLNPVTRLIVSRAAVDRDARLLTGRSARRLFARERIEPLASRHFLLLPESLYSRFGAIERFLSRMPLAGQYAVLGRIRGREDVQYGGRQV